MIWIAWISNFVIPVDEEILRFENKSINSIKINSDSLKNNLSFKSAPRENGKLEMKASPRADKLDYLDGNNFTFCLLSPSDA